MNEDFVSILIVSYNAERYIHKTIESCLNQTYKNIEVLLLDNNSKDKTVEISRKIQREDNRLKIFVGKTNLGPYNGLNFLLDKAQGKYIAIQDHDDIWYPEKIMKQINFLKKNNKYIACGTNTYYYYESKKIMVLNSYSLVTNFVDHTSLVFRNKMFRYNTNFLLADEHFEKKILAYAGKIGCIQTTLTIHRIKEDGTNLSSYRFRINLKNIMEYFFINGFNISSINNLLFMMFIKIVPESIIWKMKNVIASTKGTSISLSDFVSKNPKIDFI